MIRTIVFIIFLLISLSGFSQRDSEQPFRADSYVYFNPGALLNIPSGLQIGYEKKISPKMYVDIEGGILMFSKNPTIIDFNARNREGIRFQAGGKYYVTDFFFIGPQFLYKRVTMEEEEWLWRFENTFQQRFNTYRLRKTYAAAAELGWHYPFENSPLSLEINYALGVQQLDVSYEPLPPDVSFLELSSIGTAPGTTILPFFNYKIKLKYALGRGQSKKKNKRKRR